MMTTPTAVKIAAKSQARTVIVAILIIVAYLIGVGVYKNCVPYFVTRPVQTPLVTTK